MSRPGLVAEIREALSDPIVVARRLGLDQGARRHGGGIMVRCPSHTEKRPSCSITRGRDGTLRCRCFSCGFSADAIGLVAVVERLDLRADFPEVLQRAAALAGIPADDDRDQRRRRPHAPRRRPVAEDLAIRIDSSAQDWLAGRTVRSDPVVESASMRVIAEAFGVLAVADLLERLETDARDRELERLADEYEQAASLKEGAC
jgi:hypothetical protein